MIASNLWASFICSLPSSSETRSSFSASSNWPRPARPYHPVRALTASTIAANRPGAQLRHDAEPQGQPRIDGCDNHDSQDSGPEQPPVELRRDVIIADLFRNALEQVDERPVLFHRLGREAREILAEVAIAGLGVLGHCSLQEAAAKRAAGHEVDAKLFACFEDAVGLRSACPKRRTGNVSAGQWSLKIIAGARSPKKANAQAADP